MANIVIGDIHIGAVSHSSGVFTGSNAQAGWRCRTEQVENVSDISGDGNEIKFGVHLIMKGRGTLRAEGAVRDDGDGG